MAPKDKQPAEKAPEAGADKGERIAKVLSRRGVASRREAERLIEAGEVTVNGKRISSPALNVTAKDRITISGHRLPDEEPARLWLYYKPEGLVTSSSDEKGRDTVFDHLPADMPRVMSVGRLDLNSEGLLLLTNDGELKRRLELPSTGWLRKYRVRVNGTPTDEQLEPLRKGITVDGERFQPMQVSLDRIQGANAWLTVGLREGKNREIRRALNAIDLYVNRLIRTSYGPFRLNDLQPGQIEEIRPKVLRDQLGEDPAAEVEVENPRRSVSRTVSRPRPDAKAVTTATTVARTRTTTKDAPLPRPVKPGDGVKSLSRAWTEAVRPAPDRAASDDEPRKPGRNPRFRPPSSASAKSAPAKRGDATGKPIGKPTGKPTGKPPTGNRTRTDAKPAAPRKPSGKPAGKPMGKLAGKPPGKPRTRG